MQYIPMEQAPVTPSLRRLLICTNDESLRDSIAQAVGTMFSGVHSVATAVETMEALFDEPPEAVLIDPKTEGLDFAEILRLMKSENVYRRIPVILCLEPDTIHRMDEWNCLDVDDYTLVDRNSDRILNAALQARIKFAVCRAHRYFDSNPLTQLPGNTSIIRHIQERIDVGADFAMAYVDLDHFKSYNDAYGFARGDEVLLMTARLIMSTVREMCNGDSFVGHIGGDDFLFLIPSEMMEAACKRLIRDFDTIIMRFYDESDRIRGCIESTDRSGKVCTFPILALSIAVVANSQGRLKHYAQAAQIAAELKHFAKKNPKSSYVFDRRISDFAS
jgi:diguanylate cyclase (GGDEF)-like protein